MVYMWTNPPRRFKQIARFPGDKLIMRNSEQLNCPVLPKLAHLWDIEAFQAGGVTLRCLYPVLRIATNVFSIEAANRAYRGSPYLYGYLRLELPI